SRPRRGHCFHLTALPGSAEWAYPRSRQAAREAAMICDVHAHYTPRNFSEFMGDRFASPTHLAVKRGLARHPFSDTQEDIEARFRLMEDAGVGRQVLSPNHPPYLPDEAECVT